MVIASSILSYALSGVTPILVITPKNMPNAIYDLIILALATGYWAHAISKTHGAFGMFEWTRKHLPLGGLTTCPVCLSFWIAIAFWLLIPTPLYPIVTISAAAGAATLVGFYTGMWQ